MKNIFILLTFLFLTSCAQMRQNWIDQNCNEGSAFSAGVEDAQNGREHNAHSFGMCEQNQIGHFKKKYSEGYNSVPKPVEPQVIVKEVHKEAPRPSHTYHHKPHYKKQYTSKTHNYYECHAYAFGDDYFSSHYSRASAKRSALRKCEKRHNKMHCEIKSCKNFGEKQTSYSSKYKRKYTCTASAFSNNYTSTHLSIGKAKYTATKKCEARHAKMHCKRVSCSRNKY